MAIHALQLYNFRSHKNSCYNINSNAVMVVGANGAGKTNLLEAISYLTPGYGLHGNRPHEGQTHGENAPWVLRIEMRNNQSIAISCVNRRIIVKLNGDALKSRQELLSFIRIVWLTPAMDAVLDSTRSLKRKFIDRLTYNFLPEHASLMIEYEKAQKARFMLLKQESWDEIWLSQLEKIMSEHAIIIARNRQQALNLLHEQLLSLQNIFNIPKLTLNGYVDENYAAENITELLRAKYQEYRKKDILAKRTLIGVHNTNLTVSHVAKNIPINLCSTGEQKILLIAIMIAQAMAIRKKFNGEIILLLDDIFSHLDKTRREQLILVLTKINAQCWITATENILSSPHEEICL